MSGQVYGVYIAPQRQDDFRDAAAAEPETSNRNGNENDRSLSAPRDQGNVRNGSRMSEQSTPLAARTAAADDIRIVSSYKDEIKPATSPARPAPIHLWQRPWHSTRTTSEDHPGRNGGIRSSTNVSHRSKTTLDNQTLADKRSNASTNRKSRDEAELLVENEIVEAMKREQELRYKL